MRRLGIIALLLAFLLLIFYPILAPHLLPSEAAMSGSPEARTLPQTVAQLTAAMADFRKLPKPKPCRSQSVLVLYDTAGEWGYYGELYAIFTANLVGRWADADAMPVSEYRRGDVENHGLTVYIGSSFEEVLPRALTDDLGATKKPVLWMNYGLDGLAAATKNFTARYGMTPGLLDHHDIDHVEYRGVSFTRQNLPGGDKVGELATVSIADGHKVEVLATAVRSDGVKRPWALRSGNLTFVSEIPYVSADETDRYLVFADILTRLLAPNAPDRHRAMLRIEDVGPDTDPVKLRALADYLAGRRVPFSVGVYDTFRNPLGNPAVEFSLADKPLVASALRYMMSKGGTLVMHGHTHQLGAMKNPYSGKSAADFEFFRAHIDAHSNVVWDGPDQRDSRAWALARIDEGLKVWAQAGLPRPQIFEFPHYAGSALDYSAAAALFQARYEHSQYYTGTLRPVPADGEMFTEQFFPYPVRDVYGQVVLPEDMGNYTPVAINQHAARTPAQILDVAARDFVLKDGFASFYHHWYLGTGRLRQIVEPMQAMGWTFVAPAAVMSEMACR